MVMERRMEWRERERESCGWGGEEGNEREDEGYLSVNLRKKEQTRV